MSMSIELSNTYIKANNKEEATLLKFYDSDGDFIDYISLDELGPGFDDYSDYVRQLFFTYLRLPLTDKEIADILLAMFSNVDDVIYNPDFDELDTIYGHDYVNRVGSVAILMKE